MHVVINFGQMHTYRNLVSAFVQIKWKSLDLLFHVFGQIRKKEFIVFSQFKNGRYFLGYRLMSINEKNREREKRVSQRDFYRNDTNERHWNIVTIQKQFIYMFHILSIRANANERSRQHHRMWANQKNIIIIILSENQRTHTCFCFLLFYSINLNSYADKIIDFYCSKFVWFRFYDRIKKHDKNTISAHFIWIIHFVVYDLGKE